MKSLANLLSYCGKFRNERSAVTTNGSRMSFTSQIDILFFGASGIYGVYSFYKNTEARRERGKINYIISYKSFFGTSGISGVDSF